MRVLDLFCGLKGWSVPFEERGHEVFSVDMEEGFQPTWVVDVLEVKPGDLPSVDVVLASPPCETFSVMRMGRNWFHDGRPKTAKAELHQRLVLHTRALIDALDPAFFVIENPVGRLRTLGFLSGLGNVVVTYCSYGAPYMKPTDLWGGFPPSWVPRPRCYNRSRGCHHEQAPRGNQTGIQGVRKTSLSGSAAERAKIPQALALELCLAMEMDSGRRAMKQLAWS